MHQDLTFSTPSHREENSPFTTQRDDGPVISLGVSLLVHLGREGDGTHDAIAKLLIQHRLVRISIILHDLIQSIDERFFGWHLHRPTTIRETAQLSYQKIVWNPQQVGQVVDIFWRGLGLAIEDGSRGDLITTNVLADSLETQLLSSFGIEEGG